MAAVLTALHERVRWYEVRLKLEAKLDARVRLLQTIPGVGAVTVSALAVSIGDGHQFRNGCEFAAWLGLTPANKSSGGKELLGRITKMGDQYQRQLLVVGATSLVRQVRSQPERANIWLELFCCITNQELITADINIAAPIIDSNGQVIATITASGPKSKWTRSNLEDEVAFLVTETAKAISA